MKNGLLILFLLVTTSVFSQPSLKDDFRIYLENDTVMINTYSSKTLYIIADSTPIYKNAKVKVIFPKFFGEYAWDNMLWILIPPNLRAGYLQASSVSTGKRAVITSVNLCYDEFQTTPSSYFDYKFGHENNQRIATIEMLDTLPVGDTLRITYGANGSATHTYNSIIAQTDNFSVLLDNRNNGNYIALRDQPEIVFKHSNPKNLNMALASTGNPGKPALLRLMINDVGKNIAPDFDGVIQLSCSDASAILPSTVNITPADQGAKDVHVTFSEDGVFTITAKVLTSNYPIAGLFVSNPINISKDSMHIYWGDFHTHGKFSRDGFGDDGYQFARNAAGFDFYSATDHSDYNQTDTFGINRDEWKLLQHEAIRYNQPGRFVSFLGYENSLDNPSGHYNFIYNFDDSLMSSVPMLAKNPLFTIQNFWIKLNQLNQQGKVLSIPHHTGKLFGTTGTDNGASQFGGTYKNNVYKRTIEIYSGHGLCESYNPNHNLAYSKFGARDTKYPCYAQDAWALGEKLGVIASTDSHNGTPSQTNVGLAAILSDTLNRNSLFSNLYNRHSYATTGERIVLKFTMDNALMGDEMTVDYDSFPTIRCTVNGTDALDYIEVLKWDFKKGQYSSNPVHPVFPVIKKISFIDAVRNYSFALIDTGMRDTSLYYIRVKQKNLVSNREVWAWSSPIWVNKPHTDKIYQSDSLYNFHLQHEQPSIGVSWCMLDELNTDYFVLERRNTSAATFSPLDTIYTAHIAFQDSCYHFTDYFPDDITLFYRIKMVSYLNGITYSPVLSINIPYVIDSVYNLNADVLSDRIGVEWNAKEYFTQHYLVQKRSRQTDFQNVASLNPNAPAIENHYMHADFYPLKDTSYYRIIMNLSNGAYKVSNLDTIVFRIDSMIQFKVLLNGNNHATSGWKGVHEQSVIRYELQRSADRAIYYTISTQTPVGHLFDTAMYQYDDTTLLSGWNYYRVVQYLMDGSIRVSALDSVFRITSGLHPSLLSATELSLRIPQNIVDESSSYLDYTLESSFNTDGTLVIAGGDGRLCFQEDIHLKKGENTGKLPVGGLSTGLYHLMFVSGEGMAKSSFIIAFHGGCSH